MSAPRTTSETDSRGGSSWRGAAASVGSNGAYPRWRVFPALALGTVMATLDISIVNIALPTLSRAFGKPITSIEWVVLAYVATITGLLLAFGRLADALGRRRVYATGLGAFTAASALCAVSPSLATLVAARALQGVGAAMMTSNSSALLVGNFPPEERGKALGAFGALVGVGLALGPPLGGLIVASLSWRWIFLINLPLGLLALREVRARIPEDRPAAARTPVDAAGAALWFGSLVLALVGLSRGPALGWTHTTVWPAFALALALLVAFAAREARSPNPLLPVRLLRGRLGIAATLTFLGQAISIAIGFHLPLYLEDVLGFDAGRSGRWLAVLPLAALFIAPLAGRGSDRVGSRPLGVTGLALAAAGFAVLMHVGVTPQPWHLLGGMALVGVGLGIFTVPNTSAVLSSVPHAQLGLASGLQATMRNLGISAGAAATAAIVASRYAAHGGGALASGTLDAAGREAFARATHDAFAVMAVTALAAAVLAGLMPSASPRPPAEG